MTDGKERERERRGSWEERRTRLKSIGSHVHGIGCFSAPGYHPAIQQLQLKLKLLRISGTLTSQIQEKYEQRILIEQASLGTTYRLFTTSLCYKANQANMAVESAPNPLISTQKSSDTSLQVALHPLVLLTISDYITRHTLRQQKGPVVGALLGQQNGREITIEHAFDCLLQQVDGEVILSQAWFEDRLQQSQSHLFIQIKKLY